MSKKKREEEKRILEELRAATEGEKVSAESADSAEGAASAGEFLPKKEEILHCRRCKSVMKNGVCPTCGYKTYVPMDEDKRKKIKGILTVVCLAVFIVLFAVIKS